MVEFDLAFAVQLTAFLSPFVVAAYTIIRNQVKNSLKIEVRLTRLEVKVDLLLAKAGVDTRQVADILNGKLKVTA